MKAKTSFLLMAFFVINMPFNVFSQDFIQALQVAGSGGDFIQGVTEDSQGNIVITGTFQNSVDFDPSSGEEILNATSKYDIYLAKYSPDGQYIWAKHMGGAPAAFYYSERIRNDQDDNTYITGFIDNWLDLDPSVGEAIVNEEQQKSFFLAKYNSQGEYIWGFAMGSMDYSYQNNGWDVEIDDQENCVYLLGNFSDTIDFDPSENTFNLVSQNVYDYFIAKYSLDGQFIWAKDLAFQGFGYGYPRSIAIDGSGNYYIGGSFVGTLDMDPTEGTYLITSTGEFNDDAFLAKYNSSGDVQWAFPLGGENIDIAWTIRYFDDKIYAVGGFYETVDFDPSEASFELTASEWDENGFLAIYNDDGSFYTAMGLLGTEEYAGSRVHDIGMDTEGNIYLLGSFYGTIDFDPSGGVYNITSTTTDYDMFLSKYNPQGNFVWAIHTGGNDQEQGYFLKVNNNDQVIAFGYFDGNCDFDPSDGSAYLYGKGSHDVYMAWYSTSPGSYVDEKIISSSLRIAPNPTNSDCKLQFDVNSNSLMDLKVVDLWGREIYKVENIELSQGIQEINIPSHLLKPGMYLVQEEVQGKQYTQKLVRY